MIEKNFFITKPKKMLFIFELANNHNGSLKNALKLIEDAKSISNYENLEFGFKLQYRNLSTFLHKVWLERILLETILGSYGSGAHFSSISREKACSMLSTC